jgi:hypothetical protein
MSTMRRRRYRVAMRGLGLAVLAALSATSGCAGAPAESRAVAQAQTAAAKTKATEAAPSDVPESLRELLAPDVYVEDGSFADGGMSREETLGIFRKQGACADVVSECEAKVYAVTITSSNDGTLPPGRSVRMVHVPDVEHVIAPPAPPPGRPRGTPTTIEADLVAFFDAATGETLARSVIGRR